MKSATIIVNLCAVEAKEKQQARLIVVLQTATVLVATCVAYSLNGTPHYAVAVLSGGLVSVLNGALLVWRMSRATIHSAHKAHQSSDAYYQLRLMYFYAAERFLAVIVLLGLCMIVLKFPPLAVLGGFVTGQATMTAARLLFLKRTNKSHT